MQAAEEWRPIPGYEGRYAVSNTGRVFSLVTGRVLRPGRMTAGHQSVALGRGNSKCVHWCVLTAFVGPAPAKHMARHLDGDPANNALSNLEWSTRARNEQDKKWHRGQAKRPVSPEVARDIRCAKNLGLSYEALAEVFGVGATTIANVVKRRTHADV